MATQKNPVTPKARTCAVNAPTWASLIPDQPPCKKPTVRPAAALCAAHEKRLPKGWRKQLVELRAARRVAKEGGTKKS